VSFGRDDLPLLAEVADLVHTWIFQQKQENSNGSDGSKDKKKGPEAKEDVHFWGQYAPPGLNYLTLANLWIQNKG
jgi:hypothetical protein